MIERIVCQKCIYYYVTWELSRPHACKKFGFKSKIIPSLVVKKNSDNDCGFFTEKNTFVKT